MPGGKLYVPKLYAPLRPGSIYPDKKTPVPAKGRPAIVLVCPEKGDCRENEFLDRAAQRGIVVLVTKAKTPDASVTHRPEVDATRTGTLIVTRTSLKVSVSRPAPAGPPPSSPSQRVLLATLQAAGPPEVRDGVVLKLYTPDAKGRLPREALRDAVEWLAGELGAR